MAELTPMKRQYNEIKSKHEDCLLFFRLGDFYEMFDEDAKLASKELDLALTTRDRNVENPDERTPMCGVPYHSAEAYIARLIAKGYKIAICEQTEDPALAKGLVQRDVIRIITPGTVTESSMLQEERSNYICSVYLNNGRGAAAFCDISTGEFCCAAFESDAVSHILNELGRFAPREALLSSGAEQEGALRDFLTKKLSAMLESGDRRFDFLSAAAGVCAQFGFDDVDQSGLGGNNAAELYCRHAEIRHEPHKPPGRVLRRKIHGAGLDHPAQPGAYGIPAQRGEEGLSALGAGQNENPHGRQAAALLGGAAPAVPGGHKTPAVGGE